MAKGVIDLFLIYQFIKKLVTPFDQWEAFKLGLIDKDGNIIKKKKDRNTIEEKKALGYFDVLILNLKKLLGKIPGGKSRIATFAAALYLIRESKTTDSKLINESNQHHYKEQLLKTIKECENNYRDEIEVLFEMLDEETVTGLVAGVKQGDEPPKPSIKKPRMLRRLKTF